MNAYLRLMRLNKPIGIYLLLWPTYWALFLSAGGWPDFDLLIIFYIIFFANSAFSENKINPIYEGSPDAKIQLIIYNCLNISFFIYFSIFLISVILKARHV